MLQRKTYINMTDIYYRVVDRDTLLYWWTTHGMSKYYKI